MSIMEDIQNVYSASPSKKPLGQNLIEAGIVSISQVELALQEQKQNDLKIGEILVEHGWIKQKTADFFAEYWYELLEEKQKKPLAYYFQEAALLDINQINAVIRLQKLKHQKVRFHRLAVEQGYLKQITVDFFLAHLFNIHNPNALSVGKPYEVLRKYSQGQKNFQGIDLSKAPLMNISLRQINLDGSNLQKADLTKANLSHSSLIRVNLNLINLTKAVLTEVDFTHSFLIGANLQEAYLDSTNFSSAILQEANLESAYLAQANFSGADLSKAKLPEKYSYEVYYDQNTIFDHNFNPHLAGWINKNQ